MDSTTSWREVFGAVTSGPLLQIALRLQRARRLSVLIFHRVLPAIDPLRPGEPTAAEFDSQMRWFAANFDVLPLSEAVRAIGRDQLPRRALCITFDDGYADNHDLAMPILRTLGLPATFFVASGYLDGGCMFNDVIIEAVRQASAPSLDLGAVRLGRFPLATIDDRRSAIASLIGRLKPFEPRSRQKLAQQVAEFAGATVPTNLMMTSEQIAAMHAAGMQIGAHTVSHPILAELGIDDVREEIVVNRVRLEKLTGASVSVFAYPNGRPGRDYRREHVELVRQLGFDCALSTAWGAARAGDDLFQIPRFTPWDQGDLRRELRMISNLWRSEYEVA